MTAHTGITGNPGSSGNPRGTARSRTRGRHAAPPALESSLYVFALLLPPALLLQRQNWAVPNTGLGTGLGLVIAVMAAGATLALIASGTLPPLPKDGPVPMLLLVWLVVVYSSYFAWAIDGIRVAPLFADIGLLQFTLEAVLVTGLMSALHMKRHLWMFVKILVLCGGVYGALLVATAAVGTEFSTELRFPLLVDAGALADVEAMRAGFVRPQGMAGHPLEAGSVAAVLVPIGFGLTRGLAAKNHPWMFWAVVTGVTALGAVSTFSRSATVALVFAFAVMAMRWPFDMMLRAAGAAVAVAVAAAVAFPDRFGAYFGLFSLDASSDSSLFSRQMAREHVARVLSSHFWTGEGMGTQGPLGRPILDNQYLGIVVELGVPTLLVFIALICVPAWHCLHKSVHLPVRRAHLTLGIAGSLAALAVIFAVLDAFAFPQIRMLTFVLLALVGPATTTQPPRSRERIRDRLLSALRPERPGTR